MGGWIVEGVSTQNGLEINWINTAGGALGAVSSAVVLSTLGAAGTLVGAAVGSLCISVGGAVYAHSMRTTKDRVAAVAGGSVARKGRVDDRQLVTQAGTPVPPRFVDSPTLDAPTLGAPTLDAPILGAPTQSSTKNGLPWKRIAVMAGALFAIALAVIVAFELSTGRAVSTYTGGTSDSSVGSTFSGVTDSRGGGVDSQDGEGDPGDQAPADGQQNDVPAQDQQDNPPAQDEVPAPNDAPAEEAPAPQEQP